MISKLSKLALAAVLVAGVSCSSFSWRGAGGNVDEKAMANGVKSVDQLQRDYENQRYWGFWRGVMGAHAQAINDGLHNIHMTFNRHFMNHRVDTSSGRYTYDSYGLGQSSTYDSNN
ncbi:MAG: hypothetical protein R3F30_15030 [Planctomycetota bacterium]